MEDNIKISRRKFVGICGGIFGGIVFLSAGVRVPGYIERMLELNQSTDDIKDVGYTDNEMRFIIVGDPHVKDNNISNKESERLKKVVNFINRSDTDFVVFLGDMADNGIKEEFEITKNILADLEKPYYVLAGNHDIKKSQEIFESYFGPMQHIEKIKGYQLIFVGIDADKDKNGRETKLKWSFDFNKVNKNIPTLVFNHGPVIDPPSDCIYCSWQEDVLGYGKSMKAELDNFKNIIGVISGHVHFDSDQTINKTRHLTINGLTTIKLADMFPVVRPSNRIGYVIVKDNKLYYKLVSYKENVNKETMNKENMNQSLNGTVDQIVDGEDFNEL